MSRKNLGERQVKRKHGGRFGSLKCRFKVKEQLPMAEAYAASALGSSLGRTFALVVNELHMRGAE
jgi:hypothetical protein